MGKLKEGDIVCVCVCVCVCVGGGGGGVEREKWWPWREAATWYENLSETTRETMWR